MIFRRLFTNSICRIKLKTLLSICAYSNNPYVKTWNILSRDMPTIFGGSKPAIYPEHADVVVIGGGIIGSSVAYWLKTRAGEGLSVVVLEKDPMYVTAPRALGTLIQHFSLPENLHLAQFGADFLRNIKEHLNPNVNIGYCPKGHLTLASEKYSGKLEENVTIQKELGVKNELLSVNDIKTRYPWINTQDISLGCIGTEGEGNFDLWALQNGLIDKSQALGTKYVKAEVIGFELEHQRDMLMEGVAAGTYKRLNRVLYRTEDNEEHAIKFAVCVLAAGSKSGEIAQLANIGNGDGLLSIPLPIEQREDKVYSIESDIKMSLNSPLLTDTSGLWLYNAVIENKVICGHLPLPTLNTTDYKDEEYYQEIIRPPLINRLPAFATAKVHNLNTEINDYNTYDETGILGPHPYYNNLYMAVGFGKNGCQHAPGIGRAIAELIIDGQYTSIDLTRFTFDRLLTGQRLTEFNVY